MWALQYTPKNSSLSFVVLVISNCHVTISHVLIGPHPISSSRATITIQQASQPKKVTIHYDYSNSNLNKLCEIIEHDLDRFLHNCESFDSFLELFQEKNR